MKKTIRRLLLVFFLLVIYAYVFAITNIPEHITLCEGEKVSLKLPIGINLYIDDKDVLEASSNSESKINNNDTGAKIKVSLFNNIKVKDVDLNILPKTKVIPIGSVAGVKLYTNGVLVVGMSEIEGEDKKMYKPYEQVGIKEGDTIVSIDNVAVNSTDDFIERVNDSNGKNLNIKYVRDKKTLECSIKPIKTAKAEYKIGLWVRDSAAGVGTVTFYDPSSNKFAALGHGILDIDTEKLISISSGEFVTTNILKIDKGEKGNPGRIQGTLEKQKEIGKINQNTGFGIYGNVEDVSALNVDMSKEMSVALRDEIKTGNAEILCSLENGKVESYQIDIKKIYKENNYDNKSMKIKITDQRLIDKTGGIIQGMSGSPIIQNGKFIGAVTHVIVNDPLEGYAIFGDIMIKQMYEPS